MEPELRSRVTLAVDPPVARAKHVLNMTPLDDVQCRAGLERALAGAVVPRLVKHQRVPGGSDHGALDDVLELADVPGPFIRLEHLHDRCRHLGDFATQGSLTPVDDVPDEARDVVPPF